LLASFIGRADLAPGGEFYGPDLSNIKLISRFFKKYPDYAPRAFLSVKGGVKLGSLEPDASPANLRRSVTAGQSFVLRCKRLARIDALEVVEALDGAKRLDLFECARVDPKVPVEEAMQSLKSLIDEGLFDYIGLSECKADTLRRAHKVHPVAAVEIEISLWSYEDETRKGSSVLACGFVPKLRYLSHRGR
jgi:pyridoxine 4-dehydrogenase